MNEKYRYDHRPSKHTSRMSVTVLITSLFVIIVLGIVGYYVVKLTTKPKPIVNGPAKTVQQTTNPVTASQTFTASEPDYKIALPTGWHSVTSIAGVSNPDTQYANSWESSGYDGTSRFISIYVDNIPTNYPINLVLPLRSNGSKIEYGMISGNCSSFTVASSSLKPTPGTWQGINFICNLPDKLDDQVGTGSTGSAVNTVSITGPTKGTHSYFFLYIDRSSSPDYGIFYDILNSFEAK